MRQGRTPSGQSTLVIVHGLGDRAASWEKFVALMQPDVAVLALDLPGHGEAPPARDYHYGSLVEHVATAVRGVDRFALVEDAKTLGEQFRRELAAIVAPTLIVRGERSMLRPEQAEEILAELPRGQLVAVRGGTHFLHRQQPEELARLVREFLAAG